MSNLSIAVSSSPRTFFGLPDHHTFRLIALKACILRQTRICRIADFTFIRADESQISYPRNASLTKDTGFEGYEPKDVITQQPKKSARERIDGD